MKRTILIGAIGILTVFVLAAFAQSSPSGQANTPGSAAQQGAGRGDLNGDGICDFTSKPIGQGCDGGRCGPGPGAGRQGGMGGQGQGRGMGRGQGRGANCPLGNAPGADLQPATPQK